MKHALLTVVAVLAWLFIGIVLLPQGHGLTDRLIDWGYVVASFGLWFGLGALAHRRLRDGN